MSCAKVRTLPPTAPVLERQCLVSRNHPHSKTSRCRATVWCRETSSVPFLAKNPHPRGNATSFRTARLLGVANQAWDSPRAPLSQTAEAFHFILKTRGAGFPFPGPCLVPQCLIYWEFRLETRRIRKSVLRWIEKCLLKDSLETYLL